MDNNELGYWANLGNAWKQAKDPGPRLTPMPTPQLDLSTRAGQELWSALWNNRFNAKQTAQASSEYSPSDALTISVGRTLAADGEKVKLAGLRTKLLAQALFGQRQGQGATAGELQEALSQRAENNRAMLPLKRAHPKATTLGDFGGFLDPYSGGVPRR